jgi:hypothetical protein
MHKIKMNDVCRPKVVTCRWMKEFSSAIHNICPTQPRIDKCETMTSLELEAVWKSYVTNLNRSKCNTYPIVQQIKAFEVDYREYL